MLSGEPESAVECMFKPLVQLDFRTLPLGVQCGGWGRRQGGVETVVRIQGVDIVPHTQQQGCSSESLSSVCSGRAQPRECAQSPRPSGMNVTSFFKQLPGSRRLIFS